MGENYQTSQVPCHVEAKIWIGLGPGWISFDLRVFWVLSACCSCCTSVSFPSFRSIDNRLALFFILFLPFGLFCDLSSSTAFLTNLLTLYDNASPSYSFTKASQITFICNLILLVHVSGLLWKTDKL